MILERKQNLLLNKPCVCVIIVGGYGNNYERLLGPILGTPCIHFGFALSKLVVQPQSQLFTLQSVRSIQAHLYIEPCVASDFDAHSVLQVKRCRRMIVNVVGVFCTINAVAWVKRPAVERSATRPIVRP